MFSLIRSLIRTRNSFSKVSERKFCKTSPLTNTAKKYAIVSEDVSREFMSVFPDIVTALAAATRDTPDITERFIESLHYNVPHGKKVRGYAVIAAYKMLEKEENVTPENIRLANIIGWYAELLQAVIMIFDDLFDHSETRRGLVCWYKKEGIERAVLEAFLFKEATNLSFKKYFSDHHCYKFIIEHINDMFLKLCKAQALEFLCNKDGKTNFELFTMNKYLAMVTQKTGHFTYSMPVFLAMYLANRRDAEMQRQANTILVEIGNFYQIQNDFLDIFGDSEKTGKLGNDISEGKCTWLAVRALQEANSAQKKVVETHYSRKDPESVRIIQNLYEELNLRKVYAEYEEEHFNRIRTQIQANFKGLPQELLLRFLRHLFQRDC